jgi:glycosyltransferase involved in cell wall biosynthesis
MRLLFVSLYFHPASRYGGPIVSSWNLCRGLAADGVSVRVLTTDADGPGRIPGPPGWRTLGENLTVRYCRRAAGEFGAPGLLAHLPRELAECDAVYVSGLLLWNLPALALLARAAGRPLVIAPRGMLLPRALAGKAARKRLFLAALRATAGAAAWHATSAEERASVAAHFPAARCFCLPNPVEVPAGLPAPDPALPPYLLYLGRLHPHKQVDRILEAFARFLDGGPAQPVELRIAGTGEPGCREALEARARELGIQGQVHFLGEVHGADKARWLSSAQGLVLASKSENFGQSVAEALAHAIPCVVTRTAPWPQLEEKGCGFWVEEDGLAEGIGRLMDLSPAERRAMGGRGRDYVGSELGSESVARRMARQLESLTGHVRHPGRLG